MTYKIFFTPQQAAAQVQYYKADIERKARETTQAVVDKFCALIQERAKPGTIGVTLTNDDLGVILGLQKKWWNFL